MTNQLFEQRATALNRQVIHMDQGVAYSPEFRTSRQMSDYPSRKMEIARAIALGHAEPSDRACAILNNHILSRQGERWQNFGEDAEEYTELMITAREMLVEMGFNRDGVEEVRSSMLQELTDGSESWNSVLPVDERSDTWVFLNQPTWQYLVDEASALGELLKRNRLTVQPHHHADSGGWELFAHGLSREGVLHLRSLVETMEGRGVKRIITTCGQGNWIWTRLMPSRGIRHDIEVIDVVDLLQAGEVSLPGPVYFYAGSFNTRYLMRSSRINSLGEQQNPKPISATEELTRNFEVDAGRVNQVDMWQRPLCPEFSTFSSVAAETLEGIYRDAMRDYRAAPRSTMVVFEPYAWRKIREADPEISRLYYWGMES